MMLLSSILLPGWIFWQAELPRAPVLFRVLIGRADNAPGANTRINSLCESLVLHESHGFAGKIRKAPPPSRQLNPTLFHPKDHPVTALLDYALLVDPCVQTMSQTFNQGLDSTPASIPNLFIILFASTTVKPRQASVSALMASSIPCSASTACNQSPSCASQFLASSN